MTAARSISSHLMEGLLEWRNSGWKHHNLDEAATCKSCTFLGKVISTQIGLGLLMVTAAVETVVYGILTLAAYPTRLCTNKPYEFMARYLDSSSFTIKWSIISILFTNLSGRKLEPSEKEIKDFLPGHGSDAYIK